MKTYSLLIYGCLVFLVFNCKKAPDPVTPKGGTTKPGSSTTTITATTPSLSNNPVTASGLTSTSVTVSAVIDANGGTTISQHGFVYSKTAQTPTLTDSKTELGATTGPFPLTITNKLTGLEANTTYYVRAFATNDKGTGYGAVGQVKTNEVPVVSTNPDDAATIYVGANYALYAFDGTTGRLKTTLPITGGSVSADPAVTNGVVYTGYSTLMAYQISDNRRLWEELNVINGDLNQSISSANGILYFTNGNGGKLVAYDLATRSKKWEVVAGENPTSPVVLNGVVYVSSNSGLLAFDAVTGTRKWQYGVPLYTGVAVVGGLAYATGQQNRLHAVDIATGAVKWTYQMGTTFDVLLSCPTVANNIVYVGSGDKRLYAVDATTGAKKWDFLTGGSIYSSPFVDKGIVYVYSSDMSLYAIDAATGAKKWNVNIGSVPSGSNPVVVNDVVYSVGANKTLYALSAATGAEKWRVITAQSLTSNPTVITGNGKVYYSGKSGAQQ